MIHLCECYVHVQCSGQTWTTKSNQQQRSLYQFNFQEYKNHHNRTTNALHCTGHTSSVRQSLIVSDDDIREFFWGVSSIFIPDQIVIESFVDFPKMARVRCRLITTNSIFLLSDWDQDQNRIKIIVYWSKAMLSHFHPSPDRRRRILERVIKYFWNKTGHEN